MCDIASGNASITTIIDNETLLIRTVVNAINNIDPTLTKSHKNLLIRVFQYLERLSLINFGVFRRILQPTVLRNEVGRVIVIGAGIAGLAAARQLRSFGLNVFILEARDRIGGRISTWRKGDFVADLGAMLLTGTGGNPCAVLRRQIGMDLIPIKSECPLFDCAGRPVDSNLDEAVEREFNAILEVCTMLARSKMPDDQRCKLSLGKSFDAIYHLQQRKALSMAIVQLKANCEKRKLDHDIPYNSYMTLRERRLLDWHLANLEFANAGPLEDVLCNCYFHSLMNSS